MSLVGTTLKASKPIKTIGYFETIIESTLRVSAQKVYIVNKEKAGNLLGIDAAKDLEIIMFKSKQVEIIKALENENFVGADKTENDVNKLIDEFVKYSKVTVN